MKVRMANRISSVLMIFYKDDKPSEKIGTFDGKITELGELPEEYHWDALKEKYPEMNGAGLHPVYDTPSGELEPGCMYWAEEGTGDAIHTAQTWDNFTGPALMVVCPNGRHWNIDSRASNCTMPDDKLHRCWCRHGEPPMITVDKNGLTCAAGGGSIIVGDYHGMLQNGEFHPA